MSGQFPYGPPPVAPQQPAYQPPRYPQQQPAYPPQPYPQQPYQPPQQQPAAEPPQRDDRSAGEILAGGGGAPALKIGPKHAQANEYRGGRIVKVETRQERRKRRDEVTGTLVDDGPAFFPRTGRPIMGVVLTVDTGQADPTIDGDDGRRRMFIEGKTKKDAAGRAIGEAGCDPRQHPAIGGEMYVAYTFWGLKSPGDQQATTDWAFRYTPPASRAGAALSGGQQAPMPAPTPVQQQFGPPGPAPVPQYPTPTEQQGYPQQHPQPAAPTPQPAPQHQAGQPDRRPPWERGN